MRFASPDWLWLQLLVPCFALAGWWVLLRRRKALERFASGPVFAPRFALEVSPHRRFLKALLVYLTLFTLPIVLARPQWGTRLEPLTRRGSDVVIVLDTSLSMSAEDLAPNRLEQAKHAIGSLLDRVAGDRLALVTFAGEAHSSCPLTVDHGALRLLLDAVGVDTVPVQGTALAGALETAWAALRREGGETVARGQAIVLFSDGEDHGGESDKVVGKLAASGIVVHAVGCGTSRGAPIPLRDESGSIAGYKKDDEERVVTTRLAEDVLEQIALETGGRYYRATASEVEVDEIAQALLSLAQGELGSEMRARYEERFQFPLSVALAALLAETLLGDRRRSDGAPRSRRERA